MRGLSPDIYNNQTGFGSVRSILQEISDPTQRFLYHAFLSRYFKPKHEVNDSHRKTTQINRLESVRELGQIFRPGSTVKSVLELYDEVLADESNYPLIESLIVEM
ncbi:hypothetical protein KC669_00420 [Candidatus Dojkabacteria bacterium]|uniref:Uncharacterized protein n=1 Tax=Candidatus Dojkabacteria bacterium TaxID=2099670 RepID=A0A955LAE7_9BACT|nr:hypothetical protein [Candidatus Dojkabacteria bacterium]